MRIYIYGEGKLAQDIQTKERGEGHQAFLRNPEFFGNDNSPDLGCDVAVTDCPKIAEVFTAKGVAVKSFAEFVTPEPVVEVFKSADTGEFVTEDFAVENPKTTYKTRRKKAAK